MRNQQKCCPDRQAKKLFQEVSTQLSQNDNSSDMKIKKWSFVLGEWRTLETNQKSSAD